MVDTIIQLVREKLSSLSYIECIVLGGSRARGTHTEDSDIDIGIYYHSACGTGDERYESRNCYCQLPDGTSTWLYQCHVPRRTGD